MGRIFLLSPAHCGGIRARLLLSGKSDFPLARRLRTPEGAPISEVFSFLSGLYFRGKLASARVFVRPPEGMPGVLVITPNRGLLPAETALTLQGLRRFAWADIGRDRRSFRLPLLRDARSLAAQAGEACEAVLLGSVATVKYVDIFLHVFGRQLCFPLEFVGPGGHEPGRADAALRGRGARTDLRPGARGDPPRAAAAPAPAAIMMHAAPIRRTDRRPRRPVGSKNHLAAPLGRSTLC